MEPFIHSHIVSNNPPVSPVNATTLMSLAIAVLAASIKFLLFPEVVIGIKTSPVLPKANNSLENIYSYP